MKIQVTPTVDGRLQEVMTTLINPCNGKAQEMDFNEAAYWSERMLDINKDERGDKKFTVRLAASITLTPAEE